MFAHYLLGVAHTTLRRSVWFRYGVALIAVALAETVRALFHYFGGNSLPYLSSFPAVILVAVYLGAGPGLLTTGLTALAAGMSIAPAGSLRISSPVQIFGMALFICLSLVIVSVGESLRDALRRAAQAEEALRAAHRKEISEILENTSTARKAAEQRLRQLSRAVEQSPCMVVITDTKGDIEYVNPKFTEITGYNFEEAVGANPRILKSGEYPPESYKKLWATIKSGREWRGEFHNRKKNGELYWESASICPITDERGAVTHFLAIKEDVTEQKCAQTALVEAKQSAEKANKAKDIFLATLSHELRAPLTPVLLMASALENDATLDADLRAQFRLIRNNIELEARLIDDLLDLTKIAHGKFSIRRQNLNAGDLLATTLESVRADALRKGITLQVDAEAPFSAVYGDPARLQQVFWNLLSNAIKFTPAGGSIFVHSSNPDPERLAIEIRDTGIGIAQEYLEEVFLQFQQGAAAGKPQFGGLGLGLAIAKTIAEGHGGTITAYSAGFNCGATFAVHLPLCTSREDVGGEPDLAMQAPGAPLRILLVEDNASTREVLARMLRKDGHSVEAVGSCAEALQAAHSQLPSAPFHALVCDLGLPDGSGLDIVRELKSRSPGLISVALSGFGTDEDILQSRKAGFSEHLVKPASIQELRRALAA